MINPHTLITGRPGVGKTTLVKKIIKGLLSRSLGVTGFYTEEIREDKIRVGFRIMNVHGEEEGILSHIGISSRYRIGKYKVNVKAISDVVERIEGDLSRGKSEFLIIDEIGPMELYSEEFKEFVKVQLSKYYPIIIGTIKETSIYLLKDWGVQDSVRVERMSDRRTFDYLVRDIIDSIYR